MEIVAIIIAVGLLMILEHKHTYNFNQRVDELNRQIEKLERKVYK